MRTIIIGDVHGCLDELQDLVELVDFQPGEDRLVSLGDLLDRGPDPVGCVQYARQVGMEAVLSNHEDKHLRYRKHEAVKAETGKANPMSMREERLRENEALTDEDITWLQSLPLVLNLGNNWHAVHAGVEPKFTLEGQRKNNVIRVRFVDESGKMVGFRDGTLDQPEGTVFWTQQWQGPENIVYGHAVRSLEDPTVERCGTATCIGIDTGCVFGGRLTAMILTEGSFEFAQVDAKQTYYALEASRE